MLGEPSAPKEPGDRRDGNGYSASVSVSVSSPVGLLRLAGLPVRLNTLTLSSPASFSAKCTRGVLGALCALECFLMELKSPTTFGEEEEDLSDGLRGRPLERIIGVLGVRGIEEPEVERVTDRSKRGVSGRNGEFLSEGDRGDDVGNGTWEVEPEGDVDGGEVLNDAVVFGISMCEGGFTEGEKRPVSMDSRRELTEGMETLPGRTWGDVDGELSSSGGESSSTERWKTAFLFASEGRRRGREPREVNVPWPRSSLKDERVRRCPGRPLTAVAVVVADEVDDEEGSAGYE
jgi:hypothetical protein